MKKSESPFAPLQVNLIVGMTSADGVSFSSHSEFQDLQRCDVADASWDTFSCSYVYDLPAIHSNLYVWTKKGEPVSAYIGSAHFFAVFFFYLPRLRT